MAGTFWTFSLGVNVASDTPAFRTFSLAVNVANSDAVPLSGGDTAVRLQGDGLRARLGLQGHGDDEGGGFQGHTLRRGR